MQFPDDIISRAGRLLYRELPEEYRYRDTGPPGDLADLEAYLHGFGHLLDLVRHTTEQAYADAFAEAADNGYSIQPWLIPYLAELVGADLLAPDPARRLDELNNSVLWSKSKGTLHSIDAVGDVVSGAETVVREGWKLTLTCPRQTLPPFSVPAHDEDDDPLGRTAPPMGCPDLRRMDRAVQDAGGANPLFRLTFPQRDGDGIALPQGRSVYWKPRAPGGSPCFPGAYDDGAARCPDLRDPSVAVSPGPHPRRSLLHLRPPDGFFAPGLKVVTIPTPGDLQIKPSDRNRRIGPRQILDLMDEPGPVPDRLIVELGNDLTIPAGADILFQDILFTGQFTPNTGPERAARIRVQNGARVTLLRSAAERVVLSGNGNKDTPSVPPLVASDSLLGAVIGPNRFAELIHCTVLGETDLARLHASDCLLGSLSSNLNCDAASSCIRFSRFEPPSGKADCFLSNSSSNTSDPARFVARYLPGPDGHCVLRLPRYGEAGCAVLDTTAPDSIAAGAEDEGEMGAGHHLYLAAGRRALEKKLTAFLPLGQEIALRYDPLLAQTPPELA
ncbi:hypothetical protein I5535_10710 [Rhodobacteraceae bacterium F11138]|nr:hypothetical protein [Rhodobacteraceae bacterium F11138]